MVAEQGYEKLLTLAASQPVRGSNGASLIPIWQTQVKARPTQAESRPFRVPSPLQIYSSSNGYFAQRFVARSQASAVAIAPPQDPLAVLKAQLRKIKPDGIKPLDAGDQGQRPRHGL